MKIESHLDVDASLFLKTGQAIAGSEISKRTIADRLHHKTRMSIAQNKAALAMRLIRLLVLSLIGMAVNTQAASITYVYTDAQGTPLAEANGDGAVTTTYDYRPYGSMAMGTGGGVGYTGQVMDEEAGVIYMQARYFDPVVGRFLSLDPEEVESGNIYYFNRFSYAGNDPINMIDPFGKYFCKSKSGCADFKTAYAKLKDAASQFSGDSKEGKAIAAVISYYGDEGQKNADGKVVNVKEGATSTGNPGEISHNWVTGSDTVTIDFGQIKQEQGEAVVEMAAAVGHEGQHGVDDAARRKQHKSETENTVRATEHNAYTVQSYVNEGLGVDSVYGLWRQEWPTDEVEANRAAAVNTYSEGSVKAWLGKK